MQAQKISENKYLTILFLSQISSKGASGGGGILGGGMLLGRFLIFEVQEEDSVLTLPTRETVT